MQCLEMFRVYDFGKLGSRIQGLGTTVSALWFWEFRVPFSIRV